MAARMGKLAAKDFTVQSPGLGRRDEIGEMARAVEVFRTSGLEVERMRSEQAAQEIRAAQERKVTMHKLADEFEAVVGKKDAQKIRMTVKPPMVGQITYTTCCEKFFPIVTRHVTKEKDRLITARRCSDTALRFLSVNYWSRFLREKANRYFFCWRSWSPCSKRSACSMFFFAAA